MYGFDKLATTARLIGSAQQVAVVDHWQPRIYRLTKSRDNLPVGCCQWFIVDTLLIRATKKALLDFIAQPAHYPDASCFHLTQLSTPLT